MSKFYAHINLNNNSIGVSECVCTGDNIICKEISQEIYSNIEHYVWDGENIVINPNYDGEFTLHNIEKDNEEMKQARADAYAVEVDPITAHIQRLKDENPVPEGEIAELIAEREAKVQEIKERYPYSGGGDQDGL